MNLKSIIEQPLRDFAEFLSQTPNSWEYDHIMDRLWEII